MAIMEVIQLPIFAKYCNQGMKSVYSTSEWNCFKNYILNDFYIECPIVDSIVTMLDRSNLRYLYTTSRNKDEKMIDL